MKIILLPGSLLAAAIGRTGWDIISLVGNVSQVTFLFRNSIGSQMAYDKKLASRFTPVPWEPKNNS